MVTINTTIFCRKQSWLDKTMIEVFDSKKKCVWRSKGDAFKLKQMLLPSRVVVVSC